MRTPSMVFLICCCLALLPGILAAQVSFESDITGYPIGTPITFTERIDCIQSDPQNFMFWNFGPGASPATASSTGIFDGVISVKYSQNVIFSTPGDKAVTVTCVKRDGSSSTWTHAIHIYDCSSPSIPHDAIVINSDTTIGDAGPDFNKTYWINPGFKVLFNQGVQQTTIFAESGSTISGAIGCLLYMKQGSVFTSSGGRNNVIGGGASIDPAPNDFNLNCSELDFDYSNAAPNAAHPLSLVKDDLITESITLFPNPTTGVISVKGAPSNDINISVMNVLGETVIEQKNIQSPEFTVDLSKLAPGIYYLRLSSANSVVTKKVVKE